MERCPGAVEHRMAIRALRPGGTGRSLLGSRDRGHPGRARGARVHQVDRVQAVNRIADVAAVNDPGGVDGPAMTAPAVVPTASGTNPLAELMNIVRARGLFMVGSCSFFTVRVR